MAPQFPIIVAMVALRGVKFCCLADKLGGGLVSQGQEVESGHRQNGVDTQQPVFLEHLSDLLEEDAGLRLARLGGLGFLLLPGAEEDFALRKKDS